MDHACSLNCSNAVDQLRVCINGLTKENGRLAKDKADALKKLADIQKQNLDANEKYKDAHARYKDANENRMAMADSLRTMEEKCDKRVNDKKDEILRLNHSLNKRVKEKDLAVQENYTLTAENLELRQTHAELGEDNAVMREECARLLDAVQPLERQIVDLKTENASLKRLQEQDTYELDQHISMKEERDRLRQQVEKLIFERDSLLKQIDNQKEEQRGGRSLKRARPNAQSRSPQYETARDHSKERVSPHQDRQKPPCDDYHNRYDHYEPDGWRENNHRPTYDTGDRTKFTSPRYNELNRTVHRHSSRLLTPGLSPGRTSTTDNATANSSADGNFEDYLRKGKKPLPKEKNAPKQKDLSGASKYPKTGFVFSLKGIEKKLPAGGKSTSRTRKKGGNNG